MPTPSTGGHASIRVAGAWGAQWPSPQQVAEALATHGIEEISQMRVAASEDDLTALVTTPTGRAVAKLSSEAAHVTLQAQLLDHVTQTDAGLPVPRVIKHHRDDSLTSTVDACHLLVTEFCAGSALEDAALTPALVDNLAAAQGALVSALAGSTADVPASNDWSIATFPAHVASLAHQLPIELRPAALDLAGRWETDVLPVLEVSPRQVIHADLNLSNVLVDGDHVTGILDFGDAIRAPRVLDVAVTSCYLGLALGEFDHPLVTRFTTAMSAHIAMSLAEITVVPDLALARAFMVLMLGRDSARTSAHPEYALRYDTHALAAIRTRLLAASAVPTTPTPHHERQSVNPSLTAAGNAGAAMINRFDPEAAHGLGDREAALLKRRRAVLGDIYPLFYSTPIHVVRGEGARLYDADGHEYLDAYNNVLAVGHGNTRVADAVDAQLRRMNTHTRYLQSGVVDYAERFVATYPEQLDRVIFTNSGSEANDLALMIARWRTGNRGVIVTRNAYHGTTAALAGASPENGTTMPLSPYVRTVEAPDTYRYGDQAGAVFEASVREAIEDLNRHGWGVSALLLDTIMSTDGIFAGEPGMLRAGFEAVQHAGGLVIADEVQPGVGRLGYSMWGFQRHTDNVDMVSCGKPLAGGLPIGTLVLSRELSDGYAARHRYFNTFGGNPASIAAATAVLDEVEDRGLVAASAAVGRQLEAAVAEVSRPYSWIRDIRGAGLFIGVEMGDEGDRSGGQLARAVVDGLRERRVLISAVGDDGRVLKVRPPLVFTAADVALFAERYADTLAHIESTGGAS